MTHAIPAVWGESVPTPLAAVVTLVGLLFGLVAADQLSTPAPADPPAAASADTASASETHAEPSPVPPAPDEAVAAVATTETTSGDATEAPEAPDEPVEAEIPSPEPTATAEPTAPLEQVAAAPTAPPVEAPPVECAPTLTVAFGNGSRMVPPDDAAVRRVVDWAQSHPDAAVVVRGHADSVGSESYNLLLSRQRAQRVETVLEDAGLPEGRVTIQAFGEYYPAAGEPEDAMVNRRVVVELLGAPPCEEIR